MCTPNHVKTDPCARVHTHLLHKNVPVWDNWTKRSRLLTNNSLEKIIVWNSSVIQSTRYKIQDIYHPGIQDVEKKKAYLHTCPVTTLGLTVPRCQSESFGIWPEIRPACICPWILREPRAHFGGLGCRLCCKRLVGFFYIFDHCRTQLGWPTDYINFWWVSNGNHCIISETINPYQCSEMPMWVSLSLTSILASFLQQL